MPLIPVVYFVFTAIVCIVSVGLIIRAYRAWKMTMFYLSMVINALKDLSASTEQLLETLRTSLENKKDEQPKNNAPQQSR